MKGFIMRILHINSYKHKGGAARAAWRLHESLLTLGEGSTFYSAPNDDLGWRRYATHGPGYVKQLLKSDKDLHSNGLFGFEHNFEWINSFDVVHLHWVNGFMSNKDIDKIVRPIVWTIHDFWPLTGDYHYGNGNKGMFERASLIIAPTNYAGKQVRRAGATRVVVIPHPIDTKLWVPGIEKTNNVVSIIQNMHDKRKGADIAIEARAIIKFDLDDAGLRRYYQKAACVLMPSARETFSLVTQEAMACGTPVVAFEGHGPDDLITSYGDGILIKDREDIPAALDKCIYYSKEFGHTARLKAQSKWDYKVLAPRFMELYRMVGG